MRLLAFTSLFSSSYTKYLFLFTQLLPATNDVNLYCVLGTGAGPTYVTANYNWGSTTTAASTIYQGNSNSDAQAILNNNTQPSYTISNAGSGVNGQMLLMGPNASSQIATGVVDIAFTTGVGVSIATVLGSWSQPAATFTAIKFFMNSGNIASGTIDVYGILPG